jgi:hypothetical protein
MTYRNATEQKEPDQIKRGTLENANTGDKTTLKTHAKESWKVKGKRSLRNRALEMTPTFNTAHHPERLALSQTIIEYHHGARFSQKTISAPSLAIRS